MTALQEQLAARNVTVDQLVNWGFAEERAVLVLGGADPTIEEVRIAARRLKLPPRIFLDLDKVGRDRRFRLRRNLAHGPPNLLGLAVADLLDRAGWLASITPEGKPQRPHVDLPLKERGFEQAEALAAFSRDVLLDVDQDAPLIELDRLLCRSLELLVVPTNDRVIEGAVVPASTLDIIFLARRNPPRMRFTLAHEFAHFLVDVGDGEGWVDGDVLDRPVAELRVEEQFANAFASALLLPASGIGRALSRFRSEHSVTSDGLSDLEVMFVARFFGVNFQVAARRLEDLKLLPTGGGQSLYETVSKRFGSPEKMADQANLPPREEYEWNYCVARFAERIRPLIIEGEVSVGRLTEMLDLPITELSQ